MYFDYCKNWQKKIIQGKNLHTCIRGIINFNINKNESINHKNKLNKFFFLSFLLKLECMQKVLHGI